MRDCVLCPPLRFRFNEMADLPSGVLARDDDFLIMPDLAPVAPGHLLLVSEEHWICGGALPGQVWRRACAWRDRIGLLYEQVYGAESVIILEHGPAMSQGGGACIDHFHWHLLPGGDGLNTEIHRLAEAKGLTGKPVSHPLLREFYASGRSYVMASDQVYEADGLPNQFLRAVVSTALSGSVPVRWRWQEVFGLPASRALFLGTLKDLSDHPHRAPVGEGGLEEFGIGDDFGNGHLVEGGIPLRPGGEQDV
jgi:diadenosine tetraphosphate (Ap4A) HIT family hydrolase